MDVVAADGCVAVAAQHQQADSLVHRGTARRLDPAMLSWAILVQRRVFGMVLTTGERLEWRLSTRPCVMIASKSAGCYWDAIMENGKAVGKNQKEEINPSLVTALIADVVAAFPDCK